MGRICVRCEARRPRASKIALLDQPDFGDLAAAAVAAQARLPLPGQRQLAARSRFRGNIEFDIPAKATAGGELTLTWQREPGLGGNGRGCQVSEVWLIKKSDF